MKFCTKVRLKPSNDRGEFELNQARRKNNIVENSIALGHETHYSLQPLGNKHNILHTIRIQLYRGY